MIYSAWRQTEPVQCSGPVAGHHVVVLEVLLLSLSHVSHLVPETTKLFFQKIPITNNLQIKLKTNKSFKAIKLVIANFILNVSPSVSSIYPFHFIYISRIKMIFNCLFICKASKVWKIKIFVVGKGSEAWQLVEMMTEKVFICSTSHLDNAMWIVETRDDTIL